ncbi:MAG TPA: hypothetical protein VGH15_05085 [Caulobacteraceae bacterium]|jgi:hypothetical protein
MKQLLLSTIAAAAVLGLAGTASAAAPAGDGPPARLVVGVYNPAEPVTLEQAQFVYGGRNYCWYPGGWHGPGYYWCGYAYRRGFGWGGPRGWNGWGNPGWRAHARWRNHVILSRKRAYIRHRMEERGERPY